MNIGNYAKAIMAGIGSSVAWIVANVEITDSAIVIPLSAESAGMAAGAMALVYGVYKIPNKTTD